MWDMKCMIIPVTTASTGMVTKIGKIGSRARNTFDRFTTKDNYTWNSTHNTESAAV
jgi:hypothetical protein